MRDLRAGLRERATIERRLARRDGAARASVFEPAMHAAILEREPLEDGLRRAVERSELHLCHLFSRPSPPEEVVALFAARD